jgi:hypothetical protein
MNLKQYCWQRDPSSLALVLYWSQDGGQTWEGYYKPIPGKVYNGEGQMRRLNALKEEGYVYIEHPSMVQVREDPEEIRESDPEQIEAMLDRYGEEDHISLALSSAESVETDFNAFIKAKQKRAEVQAVLELLSPEEAIERALHELEVSLEEANRAELIKIILGAFKGELSSMGKDGVIEFAIKKFEQNDRVQKMRDAIKLAINWK